MRPLLLLTSLVPALLAQDGPGSRPDGSIVLPNGWRLTPHGEQLPLAHDLPLRLVWHQDGRHLAIQHAGYRAHGITLFDAAQGRCVAEVPLARSWRGCTFSADGRTLFVSGGVDDLVYAVPFAPETARFSAPTTRPLGDPRQIDLPAGIALDADGGLVVALQRGHALAGSVATALPAGAFPYDLLRAPDGGYFVSCWGRGEVLRLSARGAILATARTGEHPSELLLSQDGARLFVSNANENTTSVIDVATFTVEETLASALYPDAPPGSTPNALALSPDGHTLLIANADNNDLAVFDVRERRRSRALGFIPTGWYPTAVTFTPDGKQVLVANGKGGRGSHANPGLPQSDSRSRQTDPDDYTGSMFTGTLSRFAFPDAAAMQRLTAQALRNAPLQAGARVRGLERRPEDSPIPARVGDPSPIRYVVYVIKENRTYDQVFGDVPRGNGDPRLCIFGADVTPNHHAIADTFVLLDNFYVESEVSADGHEWTMGAYATDFVERTWPVTYGGKGSTRVEGGRPADLGYPAEGEHRLARPKNGYLWDLAKAAGLSYRSYGEFVANGATPDAPGTARAAALEGHFDPYFRSYDLEYRDVDRAARFCHELAEFERKGELPRLIVLRLPNDHTAGTKVGALTPRAMVADNDLALGTVLAALAQTRFWRQMAVFCIEDDAQNGPDHVDAHRTVGLVAGPYVRRGAVVSTMYSTCSMLRTIELILGLPPMSQFDAAALPMYDCFTGTPDFTAYARLPSRISRDERNGKLGWGAGLMETMNLATEDAADDFLFNEAIWRSVRGADSPMPAPRRAAFVRAFGDD